MRCLVYVILMLYGRKMNEIKKGPNRLLVPFFTMMNKMLLWVM